MSLYKIAVKCTKAEWTEICEGFNQNKIPWSLTYHGVHCGNYEISCSCKWSENPFEDGPVATLSTYYPTAVFHCSVEYEETGEQEEFWLLGGYEMFHQPEYKEVNDAIQESSLRFLSATNISCQGVEHSIELMPNGKLAYEGENVFGECDVLTWRNIQAVACGDWHTVGQTAEGKLLACGSNANGQCDVQLFGHRVKRVSCGRYHTAILYENGKVSVRGALEEVLSEDTAGISNSSFFYVNWREREITFPMFVEIEGTGYQGRASRVEQMKVGDSLVLKADWNNPYYQPVAIEVFNQEEESLGYLRGTKERLIKIAERMDCIAATVESVTPLAARRKNAKYPLMTVKIEEVEDDLRDPWELPWENIVAIRSIHDALIAVDASGEVYTRGTHGLDEKAYQELIYDLGAKSESGQPALVKTDSNSNVESYHDDVTEEERGNKKNGTLDSVYTRIVI